MRFNTILETAEKFKEINSRELKKVPTLKGKTIVNLFLNHLHVPEPLLKLPVRGFLLTQLILHPLPAALQKVRLLLILSKTLNRWV